MKTAIIYHQVKPGIDCPDGICAAWICGLRYPDAAVMGDVCNDKQIDLSQFEKKDRVILCDFSYPYDQMSALADRVGELVVLDHHQTQADDISRIGDRILGGYSPNDCGATFAWRFFFPDEPEPWFLRHVRRRDIGADGYYNGDCPDSRAITAEMSRRRLGLTGSQAFTIFDQLMEQKESRIVEFGLEALKPEDDLCAAELAAWEEVPSFVDVAGYHVPYLEIKNIDAFRLISWIGILFAKKNPNAPFVALIAGNRGKVSLRSRGEFNVGVIAKSLGGGGHRNAAGFTRSLSPAFEKNPRAFTPGSVKSDPAPHPLTP